VVKFVGLKNNFLLRSSSAIYGSILFVFLTLLVFLTVGCKVLSTDGCVTCHTDEETLKAVVDPIDDPDGNSGEG